MSNSKKHVIVVGAGIVGSSIAYHLSQKGFQVTIIDKNQPASAATGSAFGWITAAVHPDAPDALLRQIAIQDWHRLEQELPALAIHWDGSIKYTTESDHLVGEVTLDQSAVRQLEPNLLCPPTSARFMAIDGSIDAKEATYLLTQHACQYGAVLITETHVSALTQENGKVTGVESSNGPIKADYVVLACGTEIPTIADSINPFLPVLSSPAILLRFNSTEPVVNTLLSGDDFEVRHARNGDLLAAEDYVANKSLAEIASEAEELIKKGLDHTQSISLQHSSIGYRPVPEDGYPIIGFIDQAQTVYVAVMHPAVTCAASIGRLVCEELTMGIEHDIFTTFRPSRFNA